MKSIFTQNLTKTYNSSVAVEGLNLNVDAGKVFGFLGPNGAGKSTTIKLLTTLIPPTEGSVEILGINALENPLAIRKRIGVVLQQPSYEPTLSAEKSLEKYGVMWNVPKKERKEKLEELIEEFELSDFRRKKNEDLSIGQRRRVQVAREFMHDMDLLFLDEPTVGLDPTARRKLLDLIKKRVKKGLTVFYTTHVLTEAEYLCDEIAIINKGKVITVDSPGQMKNKFNHEKTIKIQISNDYPQIKDLLKEISDCKVESSSVTKIIIHSTQSEIILMKILKILNDNKISIEDLSAIPTSLEDIFLRVVENSDASYN